MLWAKQPAPGVGDAVRAATDVGEAPEEQLHGRLRLRSGTVWATPLEQGTCLKLSPSQKESTVFLSAGTFCSMNALRSSEDLLDPLGAVSPFGLPSYGSKGVMRPCHEKEKLDDCALLWTLFCLSGRAAAQFLQKRRWVCTS